MKLYAFPSAAGRLTLALVDEKGTDLSSGHSYHLTEGYARLPYDAEPGWFVCDVPPEMFGLMPYEVAKRLQPVLEARPSETAVVLKINECVAILSEKISQVADQQEQIQWRIGWVGSVIQLKFTLTPASRGVEAGISAIHIRPTWRKRGIGNAIFRALEGDPRIIQITVARGETEEIGNLLEKRAYCYSAHESDWTWTRRDTATPLDLMGESDQLGSFRQADSRKTYCSRPSGGS